MYKQDWEQTTPTVTLQNDVVSLTGKVSDSSTFIFPLYHKGHSFLSPLRHNEQNHFYLWRSRTPAMAQTAPKFEAVNSCLNP